MKLAPAADGGLHIEVADNSDWRMLLDILRDAQASGFDLASQVGSNMDRAADWPDWQEFVIPDIREGFLSHLKAVLVTIETARLEAAGGPGRVLITREETFHWYSALNQARLAIEAIHHLGPGDTVDPGKLPKASLQAFIRSQFYCALQSYLLDRGLG